MTAAASQHKTPRQNDKAKAAAAAKTGHRYDDTGGRRCCRNSRGKSDLPKVLVVIQLQTHTDTDIAPLRITTTTSSGDHHHQFEDDHHPKMATSIVSNSEEVITGGKTTHLSETLPRELYLGADTGAEVSTGTSIMAVEFDGGVVVGADSRTTTGAYIANRVTDKLTKITDHIYVCRSGSAADTQALADIVAYHLDFYQMESGEPAQVAIGANLFAEMCYSYRDSLTAGKWRRSFGVG